MIRLHPPDQRMFWMLFILTLPMMFPIYFFLILVSYVMLGVWVFARILERLQD